MMEVLRQWILGVTCASMLIALADGLMPAGTVKKIGRLVGGLVLLLAVVKPLLSINSDVLAGATAALRAHETVQARDLDKTNKELMKTIIAEETGAYILDKAETLGIACQGVRVECGVGEREIPYPAAVTVMGPMNDAQRQALSRHIEAELAIPQARQHYESGGVVP